MDAVRAHLVRRDAQIVLLLTPPFDRMAHDPGYIKGYLPGIRENGGQYTHAALWTVIALARLGMGDEAMELFHMINPINHMRTPEDVERYRAEPYAVAADVYAHPMHVGRGGWTWYTGSAGWMYQAAIAGAARTAAHGRDVQRRTRAFPTVWPRVLARLDDRHDRAIASPCRIPSTGRRASRRPSSTASPSIPRAIPLRRRWRRARGDDRDGRPARRRSAAGRCPFRRGVSSI